MGESGGIRYHGEHRCRGRARRLGQCFEKFGGSYSECVCQRNDVYDRDIPFASLDAAYVVTMQIR